MFPNLTGGYDGIPGVNVAPLFGRFGYDLYGHTSYLYCLSVLAIAFYVVRRVVYSPFGEALAGIRENVARMHALGSPVHWRLVVVYTIAAAIAGTAGALFAHLLGTPSGTTITIEGDDLPAVAVATHLASGETLTSARFDGGLRLTLAKPLAPAPAHAFRLAL